MPTRLGRIAVRTGRRTGGPATILLHGAAGSWTTWTPLLSAAAEAGDAVDDVVLLDLPGWGESGDLPAAARVSDLSAAVIDVAHALGHTSWHLVGHSLGGFVALDIAARTPVATLSTTLVSPSGAGVIDAIRRPIRGGAALPGFAGMLLAMRLLAALGPAGTALVRLLGRLSLLPALAAPLFARPRAVHASVTTALAAEIRPRSFARAARGAAVYDIERWSEVACPVLSVRGARDVFAGAHDAETFAAVLPRFAEEVLADAGHFAHIERTDAVLTSVREARRRGHAPIGGLAAPDEVAAAAGLRDDARR